MRAGWSLDLITCDERGRPWNFNSKSMRNAAKRKLIEDKPLLLIGSPMCGPFSVMNSINYSKMTTEEKEQKINYGRKHLEFCMQLYEIQWRDGRYFLHEHPESASSWQEESVVKMLKRQGVVRVTGDQCRYGLTSNDGQRTGPARKRTSFMTNSPCIAQKVSLRCPNTSEYRVRDHVILINGRAKAAQAYPPALCRAVCKGLMDQMEADRQGHFLIANVDPIGTSNAKELMEEANSITENYKTVEEDQSEELEIAWDDVSGAELDPRDVRRARTEEIEYVRKMGLYTKVSTKECYERIGRRLSLNKTNFDQHIGILFCPILGGVPGPVHRII